MIWVLWNMWSHTVTSRDVDLLFGKHESTFVPMFVIELCMELLAAVVKTLFDTEYISVHCAWHWNSHIVFYTFSHIYAEIKWYYYILCESQTTRNVYWSCASVCVCVCVCRSPYAQCRHYCMDPDVTWGNGRGCLLVVHYSVDLQSVHRFRCYDNIAPNAKCQRVLVLVLCLVSIIVVIKKSLNHWYQIRPTRNAETWRKLITVAAEDAKVKYGVSCYWTIWSYWLMQFKHCVSAGCRVNQWTCVSSMTLWSFSTVWLTAWTRLWKLSATLRYWLACWAAPLLTRRSARTVHTGNAHCLCPVQLL